MTGVREASFAQTVDRVGGPDGIQTLADEGVAAHRAASQLQELARSNTPEGLKAQARASRGYRREVLLLTLVVGLGLLWIADNVVGYAYSPKQSAVVTSSAIGHATVRLPNGRGVNADCWTSAAGAGVRVWKAAAPFGSIVEYRCGVGAAAAAFPGLMSALAAMLALLAAFLLRLTWRRHQRLAWY